LLIVANRAANSVTLSRPSNARTPNTSISTPVILSVEQEDSILGIKSTPSSTFRILGSGFEAGTSTIGGVWFHELTATGFDAERRSCLGDGF